MRQHVRRRVAGLFPAPQEAGFTLVELMVALGMATIVLTAFAYAATGAVRAMNIARLNQQAADIATQRVEQVRALAWGRLGHDPSGIAPDPAISADAYSGEPLVKLPGGIRPQISTVTLNGASYTVYTYVTKPADASVSSTDNRRVTVVVDWAAYGQARTKTISTIVTLTQRGLPLPEYKLTQVGPATLTVNPGATAAFGYQLNNQGAPDLWNLTTTLAGARFFADNGDGLYNAATDTALLTDGNGDGIPDTGRLEPKRSRVFWVVLDVSTDSGNATTRFRVIAKPASLGPDSASQASVESVLVVTTSVITASPTPTGPAPTSSTDFVKCEAGSPAPVPGSATGHSLKAYVLHNSGATSWPAFPLPAADPIPGSVALKPMYLDMNPVSIPSNRALPVLSSDLTPAGETGRLLYPGGAFSSPTASAVLDFVTQNPGRSYTNSAVARFWVRPVTPGDPVKLAAQVYVDKSRSGQNDTPVSSAAALSVDPFTCNGWQEVWFNIPITTVSNSKTQVLGFKVWNTGTTKVRAAYDHGAFPATFTVVEK